MACWRMLLMRRLLIFEPESDGHRARYITSLANYAYEHGGTGEIIFAISESLVERLGSQLAGRLGQPSESVGLRLLTKSELKAVRPSSNKFLRSLSLWRTGLRIARELNASGLHFLFADDVFIASAIARRQTGLS